MIVDSEKRRFKRAYGRFYNGIQFAKSHHQELYFLTLTSYYPILPCWGNELYRHFQIMVKRIRRKYGIFEYCLIKTNEGFGVLHILFKGHRIDVDWLRENWVNIHEAPQMKLLKCYGTIRQLCNYLVSYISGQTFQRLQHSSLWVFPRWIAEFYDSIARYGFVAGLNRFDRILRNYDTKSLYSKKYAKQLILNV